MKSDTSWVAKGWEVPVQRDAQDPMRARSESFVHKQAVTESKSTSPFSIKGATSLISRWIDVSFESKVSGGSDCS